MIETSSAVGDGSVPFGVLYASSSILRHGHNVKIIDLVKENLSYDDVKKIIKDFSPGIIGMGGITACYKNCKSLIGNIKNDFKGIPIVVGGVISSVSDILLTKAGADYIIHGEGEISFPKLIHALENNENISKVKGISFFKNGNIYKTEGQPQINNLDDIPFPEFSLLNMSNYLDPVEEWIDGYFKYDKLECKNITKRLSGKKYIFPIITARGCTHRCIFCYRHQWGWRQHSVEYTISLMKYLSKNYGIGIFQINDELTTANRKWVLKFCNSLISENLGIYIIVLSARVDNVDDEMLVKLKEAGCIMINYGYESGSDFILKKIGKGVTRKQALNAGLLTQKIGIKNIPEIIIGFPSETKETVEETIDFLKQLDVWPISVNTPIPFPETPLWQYGVEHGLIKDKEEFILDYKRGRFVNFTTYSDTEVLRLVAKVKSDTYLYWLKRRKRYRQYLKALFEKYMLIYIRPMIPNYIYNLLKKIYKYLVGIG